MPALVLALISIVCSGLVFAARTQNSRARTVITAPRPTPTPTPVPRTTQPVSRSVTTTSVATPTPTPRPTPRPTAAPTPIDRIAPELGEPPPPPVLKPKPTPTPPEEFEENDVIKVNTELVTLNVRVIDRNNRPINNLRQSDFHVFEDGVAQPVESFSREEVPISYGLAVDTSGSLRSQLQGVIDAGKTIINSNKPGDETFLVSVIPHASYTLGSPVEASIVIENNAPVLISEPFEIGRAHV